MWEDRTKVHSFLDNHDKVEISKKIFLKIAKYQDNIVSFKICNQNYTIPVISSTFFQKIICVRKSCSTVIANQL